MAYALQNLNSGLAGQKTIKPVRGMGETPNTSGAPAPGPAWNTLGVAPQWDAVDALPHLKDQFSKLGYSGELYGYGDSPNASGGASEQDGGATGGGPQVSAGLQSWLDSNKYSLQGRYVGSDLQTRIADSAGMGVGDPSHYESNDASWFEKAVPFAIAAMGAGAVGQGLGLWGSGAAAGNGAFLGEGVASGIPAWDAAAGSGFGSGAAGTAGGFSGFGDGVVGGSYGMGETAALDLGQINAAAGGGALESNAALEALMGGPVTEGSLGLGTTGYGGAAGSIGAAGMGGSLLSSIPAVEAYESALPGLGAAGTTVGGTVVPGTVGAGITGKIGDALSSVAKFAKENPQLAAGVASGAATLLGDDPKPPGVPGTGTGASGGTSNDALIQKLTEQLYGANGSMANAFDYSKVPELKTSAGDPNAVNQQAIDAAYSKQTGMLDPQFQRDQQALEARLAEQGFVPGTPGYDRAMGIFGETRNKAYGSARDSSILQGYQIGQGQFANQLSNANLNNNASNDFLTQALKERNQPLNELNSLKTGQQLAYENQLGKYNADVGSSNSRNQALSQLALALGIYLG